MRDIRDLLNETMKAMRIGDIPKDVNNLTTVEYLGKEGDALFMGEDEKTGEPVMMSTVNFPEFTRDWYKFKEDNDWRKFKEVNNG